MSERIIEYHKPHVSLKPLVFRIEHQWWHFLFTMHVEENALNGHHFVQFYCSKCDLLHNMVLDKVGRLIQQNSHEVR